MHVVGMGERRVDAWLWWGGGHLRERAHLEDLGVDGRILLKLLFKKCDEEAWTGLISLSMETCGESLRML